MKDDITRLSLKMLLSLVRWPKKRLQSSSPASKFQPEQVPVKNLLFVMGIVPYYGLYGKGKGVFWKLLSTTNSGVAIMLIIVFSTGIEHEETLLSESAARETSLNTQIIEVKLHIQRIFHNHQCRRYHHKYHHQYHHQYHEQNQANSKSSSTLESLGWVGAQASSSWSRAAEKWKGNIYLTLFFSLKVNSKFSVTFYT